MRRALPLLIVLAGCGDDPSLHVEVRQPAGGYLDLVAKTVVTVYEPELDTLTCANIEYGDISEELLLGAAVAQQTVFADGSVDGALAGISRIGTKLVVARMLTAAGALVAAGCADTGDLDGDTTVVVPTIVAATVAIEAIDTDDPYGKQVTLVDPRGDSLEHREVRWRTFAPAGAVPASTSVTIDADEPTVWDSTLPACTDRRGLASVRLVPPSKIGGFATRFRVSWPARPIDVISGAVRPGFGFQLLADPPATNRCAIRTSGERRIVCAENAATAAPRVRRFEPVQGPLKNYSLVDRGTVNLGSKLAGVFAFEGETYALLANANVQNLFGTTALTPTSCADCAIDDLRVAPACGSDAARIFMHSTTGSAIRAIPIHGGAVQDLGLGLDPDLRTRLNAVGCVTIINAQGIESDVQIIVLDLSTDDGSVTRGFFRCGPARLCSVTLPFTGAGVGFVRAGTENQMIGTAFDIAGAELVAWVLRPTFDGSTYLLLDRQRITGAAPPIQLVVGKLDGDDIADLVWNMPGTNASLLQTSYGHTIEDGSRLSALAQIPTENAVDELVLGDVTGDGFDDIVGVTAESMLFLPQNVEGPTVIDRTMESTCEP